MQHIEMKDAFPVFKFNYKGKLVNSNSAAMPLLGYWNCKMGAGISTELMMACPAIKSAIKSPQPGECKMQFGELQIWCDVVPFPEAGYIGVYGYHIEIMNAAQQTVQLRMAS